MASARGVAETQRFLAQLPGWLETKVLPGAARAGANVIAQEARDLLGDRRADAGGGVRVLIANSVKVRVRKVEGGVKARVQMEGPGSYVGRWLEYGTAPHFISVDPELRRGRSARRINKLVADGDDRLRATLMINGKPVGPTVYHPGARPVPFLRPALDRKRDGASAAAQAYVNRRATRASLAAGDVEDA